MSEDAIITGLIFVIVALVGVVIAQRVAIRRRTALIREALDLCEKYSERAARNLEIIAQLAARLRGRPGL